MSNLFDNLVSTSYIAPVSVTGKQTTEAKQLAGRRFSQTKKIKEALSHLAFKADYDILTQSGLNLRDLHTAVCTFNDATLLASKTFTVCPTCRTAFKKGKPRSTKDLSSFPCNICNAYSIENRKIRHKVDLATARIDIRRDHPELFI
ncbi:MAG: hypothetical protein ACYDD5_00955 [Sulfuricurvum sp.]